MNCKKHLLSFSTSTLLVTEKNRNSIFKVLIIFNHLLSITSLKVLVLSNNGII